MPPFQPIPDRAAGYAPTAADWDLIRDNMNGATWVRLADTTLTGTAAEIEFASIDQAYAHLMLVAYLRGDDVAATVAVNLRINSSVSAIYDRQHLVASAAAPAASEAFGASIAWAGNVPAANAPANVFGAFNLLIPCYSSVAGHKIGITDWGAKSGTTTGTLEVGDGAVFWRSTTVISNLKLIPGSDSWVAGSRATLFGLSG